MTRGRVQSRVCTSFLLVLMLSICGSVTPASNARTSADGPEVVMASTRRDFGEVFAGEELEQNFPVRNNGNKPLELSQKSTLGIRSTATGYPVRVAVWRPGEPPFARTVSTRRAAPS